VTTHAAVRQGRNVLASLGELWCRAMHHDVSWPVHGHYQCKQCNRVYKIPWAEPWPASRRAASCGPVRAGRKPAKPISIAA
jgi:hypothetical protein